jgi:hypothetical protein
MFIDNKYTKWYNNIINKGRNPRPDLKTEQHHIIPECFFKNRVRKGPAGWVDGNPNDPSNITFLTCKEHFICHQLLIRMLSGTAKSKMVHALSMMLANNQNQNRDYKITSRIYESLKFQLSNVMKENWTEEMRISRSLSMKGSLNHFYGKNHSNDTKEIMSKRVVSLETRKLISNNQITRFKNQPGTFLGKTHTDETKDKIRQARLGKKDSDEVRLKKSISGKNKSPVSLETRIKLSIINKGKTGLSGEKNGFFGKHHSPEQRKKKSQEKLAAPKLLCYNCGKQVDVMNFGRWHGDKCKHRK